MFPLYIENTYIGMYLVPFYLVFEYEFKDISHSRMGRNTRIIPSACLLIEGINRKAYAAQAAAPRKDITVLYSILYKECSSFSIQLYGHII